MLLNFLNKLCQIHTFRFSHVFSPVVMHRIVYQPIHRRLSLCPTFPFPKPDDNIYQWSF
ncbi:hypothetical protein Hanom_Chr17g01543361 [Helianthus anomalus]